jgi:hypothetical protein
MTPPGSGSSLNATYAERVRELILEERVADARRVLREGLEANPHDLHLNRLDRLLALPKTAQIAKRDVDRTEEFRWLARHREEYRDRWVAVQGKDLVASAEYSSPPTGRGRLVRSWATQGYWNGYVSLLIHR